MKCIFKILFLSFFLTSCVSLFSQEKLTNESIIELKELGFSSDVIISKINTSDVDFKTGVEDLKQLKAKGISSEVMTVMLSKSKAKTQTKVGIYYLSPNGDKVYIQPNVFSETKTNVIAYALSYGIANAKTKSYLSNTNAKLKVDTMSPVKFLFVFDADATSSAMNAQNWWFRTAVSPQEFALVRMGQDEAKNSRFIVTGKLGFGTAQSGTDSKQTIDFKYKDLGNSQFEVEPELQLPKGEYCFYFKGQSTAGYNNSSVFDFSRP